MAEKNLKIMHFRELDTYRKAFSSAMTIYEISKYFPAEEKYSLVDQIRRSSRSVCANLAEAWRKRRYPAVFKNKLTDAMQEASETQSWLEFCSACKYLDDSKFNELDREYENIIVMLSRMEEMASKFCYKKD
jgi:four helix bundle protein